MGWIVAFRISLSFKSSVGKWWYIVVYKQRWLSGKNLASSLWERRADLNLNVCAHLVRLLREMPLYLGVLSWGVLRNIATKIIYLSIYSYLQDFYEYSKLVVKQIAISTEDSESNCGSLIRQYFILSQDVSFCHKVTHLKIRFEFWWSDLNSDGQFQFWCQIQFWYITINSVP